LSNPAGEETTNDEMDRASWNQLILTEARFFRIL
jgi:hypothetical protein